MDDVSQGPRGGVRFEATVHPRARVGFAAMARQVADLDLDRLPDAEGEIRLLVDAEQCSQLLDQGYEVRLQRAVPVRPLDQGLVADDDDVRAWFHARARGSEQGT